MNTERVSHSIGGERQKGDVREFDIIVLTRLHNDATDPRRMSKTEEGRLRSLGRGGV